MTDEGIVPGDFAVLPSADHTYALDNFPTDEVPNVFAFEEVKSQRKVPQSLFTIVEEHAYAYRDEDMLADDWSNLPGMNAEPQGVDVSTQTDTAMPSKDKEKVDEKEQYFKALSAVEKSIRMVTLTVSRPLIQALESTASFLKLSLQVKGNKVRATKVSDLLRILMCSPKFSCLQDNPETIVTPKPPPLAPCHLPRPSCHITDPLPSSPSALQPFRDVSFTRCGRQASKFNLSFNDTCEKEIKIEVGVEKQGERKAKYQCPHCQLCLSTGGCLTRHVKSVHGGNEPQFACDRCPAKYKRRDTLMEHQAMKHKEEEGKYVFKCKHCFRTFKRQTLLKDHMNTHTGIRTHPCPLCPLLFSARSVVRYHLRTMHSVTAASLKQS